MNTRLAEYSVFAVLLVAIITTSLMTGYQPVNSLVLNSPISDSTSPQPQETQPAPYIPRSEPSRVQPPSQPVPQQVVIQFASQTTDAERIEYIESIGGTVNESIDSLDTVVVNVSEEVAQEPLPESPLVTVSEPDYYISSLDDLAPVNDPRYMEQWALPAIGAPSAWAQMPADAPMVTVAVIDSGICADHPDLIGRILDGWDFLESDATPQDDFGHGCSVSGVIAANMNDGIGIAGVAPNAQIMPLRVLNASGVGSYSDVAAAIVYATDNGAQVINLSLGGSNPSTTLENAINYAISKGVIVVAAAGNSGTEGALYPAAYPDVIAVGSVDPNLQHSSFSNYGSQIDIWAPGRDILTTKRDGSYGLVSGTSFAAPYVAGTEVVEHIFNKILLLNGGLLIIQTQANEVSTVIPSVEIPNPITPSPTPTLLIIPENDATPRKLLDDEKQSLILAFKNNLKNTSANNITDKNSNFSIGDIYDQWVEINLWLLDPDGQPMGMAPATIFAKKIDESQWDFFAPWNSTYNAILAGLPGNMVSPEIRMMLQNSLDNNAAPQSSTTYGGFLFPWVGAKTLTQNIRGATSHFSGNEIDISGTFDILAPKDGVIIYADDSSGDSGDCASAAAAVNYVVLGHGKFSNGKYDTYTLYWHLAQNSIPDYLQVPSTGIRVKAGEKIGTTGHTGYSIGNHLHFNASSQPVIFNNGQVKPCANSNYTNTYTRGYPSIPSANSIGVGFEEYINEWPLLGSNTSTGLLPISWNRVDLNTHLCDPNNSNNFVIVYKHRDYGGECEVLSPGQDSDLSDNYIGNDSISSALIRGGYTLQLFDGANFVAPSRNIENDTPNFSFPDAYWHDRASSYKVAFGCFAPMSNDEINPLCGTVPTATTPAPTQPPTATPPPGTVDGLKLISVSSPTVQKGQTFPVSVTYELVSGQLLQSRGDHLFGSDPTYGAWPVQAVTGTINPGQRVTFSFNLTAPQQTGTFESKWQMKIGGNLKGQQAVVRFTIQDAPPPPSGGGPAGYTFCADEDGTCSFSGIADVAFGANGQFYFRNGVYGSIGCNNGVFGDPINGTRKACYYKLTSGGIGVWTAGFYDTIDRWWDNNNSGNYRCSETINSQFLDVNYGTGTRCGMDPDTWVGEYTTTVNFSSGNYVFYVEHDDGLKLWVNGQNIADRGSSGSTYVCPARALSGATQLKVMLREDGGDAKVKVNWSTDTSLCTPPKPDLTPYSRDGASQPVVASLTSGNRNQDTLVAGQIAYFDWGFKNVGGGNAGLHHVKLWIDGQQFIDYPFSSLGAGNLGGFDDWGITYPNAGCYTVTLAVDTESQLDESNEGDNSWSGTMCWNPPPQPDLIPYPRPNADQPVIASLYQDWPYQDTLLTGQDAYFYWGFKNIGQLDVNSIYHVTVSIDDRMFIDYPFDALGAGGLGGFDNWVYGIYDQNLTPGPHQVRIIVDAQNQIAESNENNNVWTGTMYWRAPTVKVVDNFTTDENGATAGLEASGVLNDTLVAKAVKTNFSYGDAIKLYMVIENDFATEQSVTREYVVTNPAGDLVPELTYTGSGPTGAGSWTWSISRTIPDYLVRGEYTYTTRVTYNGTTIVHSTTFTINGPASVEVFDTFATDGNGLSAASIDTSPKSAPSGVEAKAIKTNFNAGDPIQLYIHTYNDVAADEPAYFNWSVYDPWGRYVEEMAWSGDLNSSSGWSWWWLSTTIPVHAITGDYIFVGSITHGGRTTYSETTFHVAGNVPAPSNDGFNSPTVVNSAPFYNSQDTWTATVATADPTPSCGIGQNSNSVWYKYLPPSSGILHVDAFGSEYDTVVAIWTGSISSLVEKGCNDDSYGELQSWLEIPVVADTVYYIEVMDWNTLGGGNLSLNVDFAPSVSNDDFNSPTIIATLPYSLTKDVRGATQANDDPSLTDCNRLPGQASVWYKYTPSISGQLVLDTSGSDYDTMLAVWSETRGNLTLIRCNDDIGNLGGVWDSDSALAAQLQAGTTYYVEVSRYNGKIDISGASAMEAQDNPDKITTDLGDVSSLQDKKAAVEKGDVLLTASQGDRGENVSAQFWGGQLQLHANFRPTPTNTVLYMTENQGTLRSVNQSTGSTTIAGNLGTDSVYGLSNRPGDTTYIYGVETIGMQTSNLVKINTTTGVSASMPMFDTSVLGISNFYADAIAISPATPNIAVLAGFDIGSGVHNYLCKVNLDTGAVLGAAIPTTVWLQEMAYNLDGSLLYGVNIDGQLVTVNSDTGAITVIGDVGVSSFITGLAFRPSDGELFAIDGYDQDRLVKLDATNGNLLEIIGGLGVAGPNGLAFMPGHQLNVSKSGNGSGVVTSNPAGINCGSTCSSAFNYNTVATLIAVASTGSTFTGWTGGGCSGTGACDVTMSTAQSVTATFTLNTYSLSISNGGTGSGTITSDPTGINCGSTCLYSYDYNTPVTLTATPSIDSIFTGWNGGGCSGTGACTVTMNAAHYVLASFYSIPTTPTLVNPLEGTTLPRTNNTLLDWSTTGTTCTVHVWGGGIDISPSTSCAGLTLGEQRGGAYSWQVTANNAYGLSTGAVWNFNIKPYGATALQGIPVLPTQVDLSWTLSTDEPADVDGYDIYENNILVGSVEAGVSTYSAIGLTCNTSYSYFVRSKRQGVQSDNSNLINVTAPCAPTSFNKSSPENIATGEPVNLALSWAASSGATSYEYCIDTIGGAACDTSWVSIGTTSALLSDLSPATLYYWQVRAVNSVDTVFADANTWWSFTTESLPDPFDKISPTDGTDSQPTTLILDWGSSPKAAYYEYCYDTTNDNICTSWSSNGSSTSKALSNLTLGTTYYWQVRAINVGGNTYANNSSSAFWSFTTSTTDITPPTVMNIIRATINPASTASVDFTVTFSESVIGVNPTDFILTTNGISDATVSGVSGFGDVYTVTVNTGSGNGTIRLDVVDDNSIVDTASNELGGAAVGDGNFTTGEFYTINKSNGGDTTGVFRPSNGLLYLKNANTTGFADVAINYGTGGDYPVAGDWDGNGTATIGIYRNGSFYLRNSNTLGFADVVFAFGTPGDQPVAGDWDGDGVDTIGVYSNGQFLLRNTNSAGTADMSFYLGNPGDVGIAGDWNGDGMDTTGVFRPSNGIIFLKNANTTGFADVALNYGLAGDLPVTGDWNNDGIDTIGVYRNAQFLLRNSNSIGFAEIVFGLGNPGDMPISGNWDGIP